MPLRTLARFFLSAIGLWNASAFSDMCDIYRQYSSSLYDMMCKGKSGGSPRPKSAGSTFSSAFNLNPSQAPTQPTPYGVEGIYSFATGDYYYGDKYRATYDIGIVKGFKRIGTGISTSSNRTFWGDDVLYRRNSYTEGYNIEDGYETPKSKIPNLNIGTSVEVLSSKSGFSLSLGGSGRWNKTSATTGYGGGFYLAYRRLALGYGVVKEQFSSFYPVTYFHSAMASLKFWYFEMEYDVLYHSLSTGLHPIHIASLTLIHDRLLVTGAVRTLDYSHSIDGNGRWINQYYVSVQYRFSSNLVGGYLMNYIPGTQSAAMQVFF
jgi:hypothetical protein